MIVYGRTSAVDDAIDMADVTEDMADAIEVTDMAVSRWFHR